tara:strand:+ start:5101 stop:5577 length:477 start_codon:yes stop_codon:yes gene_type:complete
MKNIKFFVLLSLLLSCKSHESVDLEVHLNDKINAWHLAASEAEFENYFDFIADHGIYIGTDVSERWTKDEFSNFSKPFFDQGKAWSFLAKERHIHFEKDKKFAWFDEILQTWMGDCRSSGVLRLIKDEWKLEHYQLSVTIDNDLMPQFLELNNIISNE